MQSAPDPNEPCPCGTGVRYADCHKPIHDAPKGKAIAVGQERYAHDWATNAEAYRSQGLYSALAKELVALGDVHRVLDVGCGLGHGIEALQTEIASQDRTLVGIDENPECLVAAAKRLGLSVDASMLRRLVNKRQLSGAYETTIKPQPLSRSGDTLLVNADLMLPDVLFAEWLNDIGYFYAITFWFPGVHKARSETKIWKRLQITDDTDHRETLQDNVLKLALRHLRPGGLVHIATRIAGPDLQALCEHSNHIFATALEGWPLEVTSCTVVPYLEPSVAGAIQVKSKSFDASGMPKGVLSIVVGARSKQWPVSDETL
jgi:SAM-dependent methyltransferase